MADKLSTARQCIRAYRGPAALEAAKEAGELLRKAGDKRGAADASCISVVATAVSGSPEDAKVAAGAELEKARASADKNGEVAMLRALAEVELFAGKSEAALGHAREAEKVAEALPDGPGAQHFITVSEAQFAMGNFKAALHAGSKALQVASAAGDKLGEGYAWDTIMCARNGLDKYDEAVKAAEAALVTYLGSGDADGKAVLLLHLAKVHNKNGKYQKAMKAAGLAQEHFRQTGSTILEEASLAEVVEGLIGLEAKAEALRQARQGKAQLQKAGDKKTAALASKSVIKAYSADGKCREGVMEAKDAMAVFRELGDKYNEGQMLCEVAKLYAQIGQFDQSKDAAGEALLVLKDAGIKAGEVSALELIGAAEDAKARLQHERDMQEECSRLVNDLKTAFANRSEAEFKDALDAVYNSESVTQEDLQAALTPVFERDPAGAQQFWDANQPESVKIPTDVDDIQDFMAESCFNSAKVQDRRNLYFGFRFGGMGYGPGFRLLKTAYRKGPLSYWSHGHTTLTLKDDHDDWEEYAGWHAGILDCALQTGASRAQ